MSKKRKGQNYSKEQKADAVKYFLDSADSCSVAAKALGIAPSTLGVAG
jgi:transposase-like protein